MSNKVKIPNMSPEQMQLHDDYYSNLNQNWELIKSHLMPKSGSNVAAPPGATASQSGLIYLSEVEMVRARAALGSCSLNDVFRWYHSETINLVTAVNYCMVFIQINVVGDGQKEYDPYALGDNEYVFLAKLLVDMRIRKMINHFRHECDAVYTLTKDQQEKWVSHRDRLRGVGWYHQLISEIFMYALFNMEELSDGVANSVANAIKWCTQSGSRRYK